MTAASWEKLCKAEKLWQAGDRDSVNAFYDRRKHKKQDLPGSYAELIADWNTVYRPKFQELLEDIDNESLTIYFERINNSILLQEMDSEQKIWMNYKLLEAEVERVDAFQFIEDNIMPDCFNIIDQVCEKLNN